MIDPMFKDAFQDFVTTAVMILLKQSRGGDGNPNVFFKALIAEWEERQRTVLEEQLKAIRGAIDKAQGIEKVLLVGSVDVGKIKERHKAAIARVTLHLENILIDAEG